MVVFSNLIHRLQNYLDEKQIRQLERTITGYFDYIEDLIERENVFTMEEYTDEKYCLKCKVQAISKPHIRYHQSIRSPCREAKRGAF